MALMARISRKCANENCSHEFYVENGRVVDDAWGRRIYCSDICLIEAEEFEGEMSYQDWFGGDG